MSDPTVPSPWLLPFILGMWLVVFPLMWMGMTGLLSIVGGWRELAATYTAGPAAFEGVRGINTTGVLQRFLLPVNYSNTLLVYVHDEGVGLATWRIFRFMHPPLLIPWTAVRDVCAGRLLFWPYVSIKLQGSYVSIIIGGWAGKKVMDRWMGMHAEATGVPAVMYGR